MSVLTLKTAHYSYGLGLAEGRATTTDGRLRCWMRWIELENDNEDRKSSMSNAMSCHKTWSSTHDDNFIKY